MKLNGYELVCEAERSPHSRGLRSGEVRKKHSISDLPNRELRLKQQMSARQKLLDTASASKRKNNQKGFDTGINKSFEKRIRPQKVEVKPDPITNNIVNQVKQKSNGLSTKGKVLAVGAGLTALGLGTAAYLKHKRDKKQQEEK